VIRPHHSFDHGPFIIGSGMLAWSRAPVSPMLGIMSFASITTRKRSKATAAGEVPIYEPGLEEIIHRKRLGASAAFHRSIQEGVNNHKSSFIAVPTPQQPMGMSISFSWKKLRAKSPESSRLSCDR